VRMAALPVEVRVAEEGDFQPCLSLDDSYMTTHTWQVEAVRGEPGAQPYGLSSQLTLGEWPLSVTFRPVRLPRARKVVGPLAAALKEGDEDAHLARLNQLKASDLALVAYQGTKMCGYLALTVVPRQGIGWINSFVVANSMRRQGVGSMLMSAARRWARYEQSRGVRAFMLQLPIKNYPAVAFCRKEGFTFCGYADYSFSNDDVVLMFVSPVVI
jgi:GNAT superfamily N-acetyltransferase